MRLTVLLAFVASLAVLVAPLAAAPKAEPSAAKAGDFHPRLVSAYMDGRGDELDKALAARPAELAGLTAEQRADVAYVRQAMAEARPPWWKLCKAGQKTPFQPTVWGVTLSATYDPAAKSGLEMKAGAPKPAFIFNWPAADMDSTEPGEYGFLKGDLMGLGIWQNMGSAAAWAVLPSLRGLSEKDNLRLGLYSDFRGNLTALYCGTPPERRWGLHIFLAAYMPQYGKGPMAASRRAAAAMFLVEVLKSPGAYPSLKLPDTLAAEGAEEKLAAHFKFKIVRRTPWTIAEDKAFRESVKTFAAANGQKVFDSGKVTLPNNLVFALMPDEDNPYRPVRDTWIKAQFDKVTAK
ncbi:MAG: hypothetical protein NTX87_07595 [Planctomycetota bacterium]|nr:hypothetical protein [Planctomycetota bacterium]